MFASFSSSESSTLYFVKQHKPSWISFMMVFVFSSNSLGQIILWAIALFRLDYIIRVNACKSGKWDIISYKILWQTYTVHTKYMVLRFN